MPCWVSSGTSGLRSLHQQQGPTPGYDRANARGCRHPSSHTSAGLLALPSSLFSRVQLFVTPWTAARQASLSVTNSWSLLKLMSIESVMPSNHLILCRPLLLLPVIFPSIRVFSNESVLCIRWPKYWGFRFSISPSNEYSGLISFWMDWFDLLFLLLLSFHLFIYSCLCWVFVAAQALL